MVTIFNMINKSTKTDTEVQPEGYQKQKQKQKQKTASHFLLSLILSENDNPASINAKNETV